MSDKDKVSSAIAAAEAAADVPTQLLNFGLDVEGRRGVSMVVPLDITADELLSVVSAMLREGVQSLVAERIRRANGGLLLPSRQLVRPT